MEDEDFPADPAERPKPHVGRETPLREAQHVARNTLGRIRSVIRRMAETNVDVQDFANHLDGRLDALIRFQILLPREKDKIGLDVLIADELLAYRAREGEQFSLKGPPVRLSRRAGESLCLAFHELATNALKFGALAVPSGHIAITWGILGLGRDSRLSLTWREMGGPSLPSGPPSHRGFGMDVLTRAIIDEISAMTTLDFKPAGVEFTIVLPTDAWSAADGL